MGLTTFLSPTKKDVKNFKQIHEIVTRLTVFGTVISYNQKDASLWEPASDQQAGSTRISLISAPV